MFEKPLSSHKGAWASENFFPVGEIVDFARWWANAFFRSGPTVVKFHFTNLKPRDKHFSTKKLIGKYQIPKSRGRIVATRFRLLMFCS